MTSRPRPVPPGVAVKLNGPVSKRYRCWRCRREVGHPAYRLREVVLCRGCGEQRCAP